MGLYIFLHLCPYGQRQQFRAPSWLSCMCSCRCPRKVLTAPPTVLALKDVNDVPLMRKFLTQALSDFSERLYHSFRRARCTSSCRRKSNKRGREVSYEGQPTTNRLAQEQMTSQRVNRERDQHGEQSAVSASTTRIDKYIKEGGKGATEEATEWGEGDDGGGRRRRERKLTVQVETSKERGILSRISPRRVESSRDWFEPTCTCTGCRRKTVLSMREREHEKRTRRTRGAVRDVIIDVDDDEINNERDGKENGKEKQRA